MALPEYFYIIVWIAMSCAMILLNKMILDRWSFSYPCFLTGFHMIFCTVMTQLLSRTTKLFPGVKEGRVTMKLFLSKVVPICFSYAIALISSNAAYIYLSVSYTQVFHFNILSDYMEALVMFFRW
jgi:hypothetical protein